MWHGFTQMASYLEDSPVIVERADGHYLIDVDGRRYLDGFSSLWVSTFGHKVPELDAALIEQLDRVAHSTQLGNGNRIVIELSEALAEVVPVDRPHFLYVSDGAAAVEQALKIAFQYWRNLGVQSREGYLALGGAYHGDTVGALSLGAGGFGTDLFDPLRFPVMRAPGYEDPRALAVATELVGEHGEKLVAVVLEPLVQGAAGMHIADAAAYGDLQQACLETGALLICDEVATGFGRTGTLFASERCGLSPDIMCLGKGLTGGYLPMSATAVNQKVFEQFLGDDLGPRTLYHGHSFQGNALAAAVALRHLRLIEERSVLANVNERETAGGSARGEGGPTRNRGRHPARRPHGWGRACSRRATRETRSCAAAVERGVLLRPLGDVIVLMPPLSVTSDEIETIVDVLAEAIDEVSDS